MKIPCKKKMTWKRAMRITRDEYPEKDLESRKKIAARIIKKKGGKK